MFLQDNANESHIIIKHISYLTDEDLAVLALFLYLHNVKFWVLQHFSPSDTFCMGLFSSPPCTISVYTRSEVVGWYRCYSYITEDQ